MVFDIVVIATVLASAVIAFLRGFIREALTILGIVGGLAAAFLFGPVAAPIVRGWFGVGAGATDEAKETARLFDLIPYTIVADALCYGVIFIVIVVALSFISHALSEMVKSAGMGPVDRGLGVLFGIGRGIILLALMYLPIHLIIEDRLKDEWFKGSRTHAFISWTADGLAAAIPGIKDGTESLAKDVKKAADGAKDAQDTREKLQGLNLLGKPQGDAEKTETEKNAPAKEESGTGYGAGQRQELENLIEKSQP